MYNDIDKIKEKINFHIDQNQFDQSLLLFKAHINYFGQDFLNDFLSQNLSKGHYPSVAFAFDKGAKFDALYLNELHENLIRYIHQNNFLFIQFIVEKLKIDLFSKRLVILHAISNSEEIISQAAACGDSEIFSYFINKGLDIHHHHEHPLRFACRSTDTSNAAILIKEYQANVNAICPRLHKTPLSEAISHNRLNIVELLLDNNAKIDKYATDAIVRNGLTHTFLFILKQLSDKQIKSIYKQSLKNANNPNYQFDNTFISTIESVMMKINLNNELEDLRVKNKLKFKL